MSKYVLLIAFEIDDVNLEPELIIAIQNLKDADWLYVMKNLMIVETSTDIKETRKILNRHLGELDNLLILDTKTRDYSCKFFRKEGIKKDCLQKLLK